MSNKTEKQTRQANILTLGVSDLSPIVGSIIADKDTIIIKKMPNGGASVFFSDQNGNVIGTEDTKLPKEKPSNIDLASLTQNDIFYLKNALQALEGTYIFVMGINSNKYPDLKLIIYINGNRLEYAGSSSRIFVKNGDVIEMKSSDYPNMNFAIDGELALGEGKDFRIMTEDIVGNIFFSDFEGAPSSDEAVVNIRVYFPEATRYNVNDETKIGEGWTDIEVRENKTFSISGYNVEEGNLYYAKGTPLVYGDDNGYRKDVVLSYNHLVEGMTITFEKRNS